MNTDIIKSFFLFSFCLITVVGLSQSHDSAFVKAVYDFKRKPDSTKPNLIANDLFILEVGSAVTKFYSYNRQLSDSILNGQFAEHQIIGGSSLSADLRGIPSGSSFVIVRSILKDFFVCSDQLGFVRYKYIDTVAAEMKWTIRPDTASFFGYKCTKATTRFRGRNYIAWFTSELPISSGPYKFCGLPGLIVKIADDKENFVFKLASLELLEQKIPLLLQEKKSTLVTRKEFKKLTLLMINDMDGFAASQGYEFHTKSINGDTNPSPPPKPPYNPIELE